MESSTFLTVNDQSISLAQALEYLQLPGKLQPFLAEILQQYILDQELKARDDLEINSALTEQAVIDFRLERQLSDPAKFQAWLASNGIDYASFHRRIAADFKLEKLRDQITAPKLQEYFIERKIFLDQVVLSRIVVADKEVADELYSQIEEGDRFEPLAQEYSLTDDRSFNGMMGPVSRGELPDTIRALVDLANPGELVGPVEVEGQYCLLRVEQFLPASLDSQVKQELQNQLFEQWLAEKMEKMTVKLHVS